MEPSNSGPGEETEHALTVLRGMSAAQQGVQLGTLVVVSETGALFPHRIWCAVVNDTTYVMVSPHSPVAQALLEDGRVCLLVDGANVEDALSATAEQVPVSDVAHPVLTRIARGGPTPRWLFRLAPMAVAPVDSVEDPGDRRLIIQRVFSDLPRTLAGVMARRLRAKTYEAGVVVIRQGEPGDEFYIVVAGEAEVVQERGGGEEVLLRLGPGESFGESALLLDAPRTATVRACTPLEVLALDKKSFEQVLLLTGQKEEDDSSQDRAGRDRGGASP
jgi:hypothetical protein